MRDIETIPTSAATEIAHDCPYEHRLKETIGRSAPARRAQIAIADALAELHVDGACPQTHIDGSPTKEWSDIIRATKR